MSSQILSAIVFLFPFRLSLAISNLIYMYMALSFVCHVLLLCFLFLVTCVKLS